jgi:hypothetical protein
MAAPVGFDIVTGTGTVTPGASGSTALTVAVPAYWATGGLDLIAEDLDGATSPTLTLDVGDASDVDRFIAASTVAQAGGTVEYRPAGSAYVRSDAASSLLVKVATAATTPRSGAITLAIYGYPSTSYTMLRAMVMRELGVLSEGTTTIAEDDALAQEALREVHETLRGRGLANRQDMEWTLEAVPQFAARPYAVMAAWRLSGAFGVHARREQALATKASEAEREMRRQTRKATSGDPVTLEPYEAGDFVLDYGALV